MIYACTTIPNSKCKKVKRLWVRINFFWLIVRVGVCLFFNFLPDSRNIKSIPYCQVLELILFSWSLPFQRTQLNGKNAWISRNADLYPFLLDAQGPIRIILISGLERGGNKGKRPLGRLTEKGDKMTVIYIGERFFSLFSFCYCPNRTKRRDIFRFVVHCTCNTIPISSSYILVVGQRKTISFIEMVTELLNVKT